MKLKNLKQKYKILTLGKSYFKRKIFAVEKLVDSSSSTAILIAGIHAREFITTDLVIKMLETGVFDDIYDFNLIVIPMVNPDGVELAINGLGSAPLLMRKKLLKINGQSRDFSLWKANGRGVDLNNNFDARFGTIVAKTCPSSQGFAGSFAESEKESKILADFTRKVEPFFTLSYHSKGEEIYFNFFQDEKRLERDFKIAKKFEKSTNYVIKNPELKSAGGFKDFCVEKLKIPAITIEVGNDDLNHPIGAEHLDEIFKRNKSVASDLIFAYNVFGKYEKCLKKNL